MCVVTFKYDQKARYPLILLANRDEEYVRPSIGIHFWMDYPDLLAGRDLTGKGTWLGLTRNGRFATLINHPFVEWETQGEPVSRGNLTVDFLTTNVSMEDYSRQLRNHRHRYAGYQLIYGDLSKICYYSNVRDEYIEFNQGETYSISNTADDLSRHRLSYSKVLLDEYIEKQAEVYVDGLMEILQNTEPSRSIESYPKELDYNDALRATPIFIQTDVFGTVGSTVILVDQTGQIHMREIRYSPAGPIELTDKQLKLSDKHGSQEDNIYVI